MRIRIGQRCVGPVASGEGIADYVIGYEDRGETRLPIRRRFKIGVWEANCGDPAVCAEAARKPRLLGSLEKDNIRFGEWGMHATGLVNEPCAAGAPFWSNWLWEWETANITCF